MLRMWTYPICLTQSFFLVVLRTESKFFATEQHPSLQLAIAKAYVGLLSILYQLANINANLPN